MTRPYARTEQVQTTLRPEEREQLDAYAAVGPSSRADAIRRLIIEGLEREGLRETFALDDSDYAYRAEQYRKMFRSQQRRR